MNAVNSSKSTKSLLFLSQPLKTSFRFSSLREGSPLRSKAAISSKLSWLSPWQAERLPSVAKNSFKTASKMGALAVRTH
eukprot:82068-Amphidinium_carterae.2